MARAISDDALAIIATGAEYVTAATITAPDGDPVSVELQPGWNVAEKGPVAGPRLGVSSLQMLTSDVDDLFAVAGFPGAVFALRIGVVLGLATEWFDVFTGYAPEGSSRRNRLGVSTSLVDGWNFASGIPLDSYTTTVGVTRATSIVELIGSVINDVDTVIDANGGYITTAGVYTDSRSSTAAKIASDGLVQAGFNGAGQLVIKAQPAIDGNLTPLWTFRSEPSSQLGIDPAPTAGPATIIADSLERTRPWLDALFNAVTVKPGGVDQTWSAQTVRLAKTCDPRHESKVGFRPFEVTSDTVASACEAWNLAAAVLTRILRSTGEKVKFDVLLNPAIEADDPFWLAASPSLEDPGWNGTYIATSVTHSPSEAKTSIEGTAAFGFELETA